MNCQFKLIYVLYEHHGTVFSNQISQLKAQEHKCTYNAHLQKWINGPVFPSDAPQIENEASMLLSIDGFGITTE